jgi:hypothetical protein
MMDNNQITKIQIFYHIFLINNWVDIVKEQIETLTNSGLLEVSTLNVGVFFDRKINNEEEILMGILLKVPNLNLMFINENDSFGESKTLNKLKEYSMIDTDNTNILYLHAKGVTQYNSVREKPVKEWRLMMEHFLITNWEKCVEKLNEGFDCCGINYQDHAANIKGEKRLIQIFNGNFFWTKSDYVKKLDDSILFEHRYSAENWILSSEHKVHSFLNVPPIFDLYYNTYQNYK